MTSVELRCPGCNALVSPGAEWCTLCYADLRTPVAVPAEPVISKDLNASAYDELVLPRGSDDDAAAVAAAEAMLAQLAAESDAPLRSLAGNFQSSTSKVLLIAGGSVVVLIVLFALMALIGSLL